MMFDKLRNLIFGFDIEAKQKRNYFQNMPLEKTDEEKPKIRASKVVTPDNIPLDEWQNGLFAQIPIQTAEYNQHRF